MPRDDHTLPLQEIVVDRDQWSTEAAAHYRQLAQQLRGIAATCQLPHARRELAALARRYDGIARRGAGR
jgi:hypothetical protein